MRKASRDVSEEEEEEEDTDGDSPLLRKHKLEGVLVLVAGSEDNRAIRIWKEEEARLVQSVRNGRRKTRWLSSWGSLVQVGA